MSRTLPVLWMALALCAAAPAGATSRSGHNMSVSIDHDGTIDDCRQVASHSTTTTPLGPKRLWTSRRRRGPCG